MANLAFASARTGAGFITGLWTRSWSATWAITATIAWFPISASTSRGVFLIIPSITFPIPPVISPVWIRSSSMSWSSSRWFLRVLFLFILSAALDYKSSSIPSFLYIRCNNGDVSLANSSAEKNVDAENVSFSYICGHEMCRYSICFLRCRSSIFTGPRPSIKLNSSIFGATYVPGLIFFAKLIPFDLLARFADIFPFSFDNQFCNVNKRRWRHAKLREIFLNSLQNSSQVAAFYKVDYKSVVPGSIGWGKFA